jgi:hypothetical protein
MEQNAERAERKLTGQMKPDENQWGPLGLSPLREKMVLMVVKWKDWTARAEAKDSHGKADSNFRQSKE